MPEVGNLGKIINQIAIIVKAVGVMVGCFTYMLKINL